MVGIVIVSHSEKLAEGAAELAGALAKGCPIAFAGGTDDGGFGTSTEKIRAAIRKVYSPDGAIVLSDMGSAILKTETVLEELGYVNVIMADTPLAEGAVAAALASVSGEDLEAVRQQTLAARNGKKW